MEDKYLGTTVNERLYLSGLLNDFDRAVEEKDVIKVISILKKVELNNASINPILEALGLKQNL